MPYRYRTLSLPERSSFWNSTKKAVVLNIKGEKLFATTSPEDRAGPFGLNCSMLSKKRCVSLPSASPHVWLPPPRLAPDCGLCICGAADSEKISKNGTSSSKGSKLVIATMKNSKSKSHVERLVTISHLFSHLSFAQNSRLFVFCAMGGCSVNSLQNNCTTGTTLSDCSQPPPGTLFHKVPSSPQASPSSSVALGRIFFFLLSFLRVCLP